MIAEYEVFMYKIICGDAIEKLRELPSGSVDLVLTDPPYNVGVTGKRGGKRIIFDWDRRDNYIDWCINWLQECTRVLKPNGVLYFWHNDMQQISELLVEIRKRTTLVFVSFCIWSKGKSYRAQSWCNRDPDGSTALRSWFNTCEYCLHFFNAPANCDKLWSKTGLDRINDNPECYRELKDWYRAEKERLGLSDRDILAAYKAATGRSGAMLSHYFRDSQFAIPTEAVYNSVYIPLGFRKTYEELRKTYEELRKTYEELRNYHRCDQMHNNVWDHPPIPSTGRLHTCQKPVDILRRIVRVSCPPGGRVLDCFMGSGSTGVAAVMEGREFIGIELSPEYFEMSKQRIEEAEKTVDHIQIDV